MTDKLHPGPHPDAELLSAFIEGVLAEHERMICLSHFAECERCREIVFLAQPPKAAEALRVTTLPAKRRWSFRLPVFGGALAAAALIAVVFVSNRRPLPTGLTAQPTQEVAQRETLPPKSEESPPPVVRDLQPKIPTAKRTASPQLMAQREAIPASTVQGPQVLNARRPAPNALGQAAAPSPPPPTQIPVDSVTDANGPLSAVKGRILDQSGSAIPGATVTIHPLSGEPNAKTQTDALGEFSVTSLPPGKYELEIESPGFQRASKAVELKPRDVAFVESKLNVGMAAETVEVTAAAPTLSTSSAELQRTLTLVTAVTNGSHTVGLDANGGVFYRKGETKPWKPVKGKWEGKASRLVVLNDAKPLFQVTTDSGGIWLSADGAHWHPASAEKK